MMMGIVEALLLTLSLLPLTSADSRDDSLDSFLEPDGLEGRYFPTISNTSLVITYTTAIVAALMLGSFLWVAATFGQGGEAGGYGSYRKKRQAHIQDSGQKVTLASDVWRRQEEEVGRAEEQLWEAWRKQEEEEEMQLREAFKRHGMEGQEENCHLLVACLAAIKQTSPINNIISSISSKRNKRLVPPHHNSVEGDYTERILSAHRMGGSQGFQSSEDGSQGVQSSPCGKLYKGYNCLIPRD